MTNDQTLHCREAFEKWYADNLSGKRSIAWMVWQAAWNTRAQASAPEGQPTCKDHLQVAGATPNFDEAAKGEVFHRMNGALCDFAMRWELDGDYLRCRKCKRPQLTNYADMPFPHASGCKSSHIEQHPWKTLIGLLTPLCTQSNAKAGEDARDAAPGCQLVTMSVGLMYGRSEGWIFAKHADGQWVSVAKLQPFGLALMRAAALSAQRGDASEMGVGS